jgi:hypothetical protein
MSWDAITFPEAASPFDDASLLLNKARDLYAQAGAPEGFVVCQRTQDDYSVIIYFSLEASRYCAELFKSYEVHRYDKPLPSEKPFTQIIP